MENAAKALLIAGGVLLAILLIVIAVYLFNSSDALNDRLNAKSRQKEIQAFNQNFTKYENYDENGDKVPFTAQDVVSMVNFMREYNKAHEYNAWDVGAMSMKITYSVDDGRSRSEKTIDMENREDRIVVNAINELLEKDYDKKFVFIDSGEPTNNNNCEDENGIVKRVEIKQCD